MFYFHFGANHVLSKKKLRGYNTFVSHALGLGSNDVPLLEINVEHMTVKLDVTWWNIVV